MPIYEYQCSKCGHFEAVQRISEPALERCPTCRRKVTKLISASAFHLKGSGWYVTDYARKQEGKGTEKGETGSDGKPDAGASDGAAAKESTAKDSAAKDTAKPDGAKKKASGNKKGGGKAAAA